MIRNGLKPRGWYDCSHLQVMRGLLDVPAVVLQGGLTLLQGDPVNRLLHLKDAASALTSPSQLLRWNFLFDRYGLRLVTFHRLRPQ